MAKLLQNIDDETIKAIMHYFHFEDYDELLRYAMAIGVRLLPRDADKGQ